MSDYDPIMDCIDAAESAWRVFSCPRCDKTSGSKAKDARERLDALHSAPRQSIDVEAAVTELFTDGIGREREEIGGWCRATVRAILTKHLGAPRQSGLDRETLAKVVRTARERWFDDDDDKRSDHLAVADAVLKLLAETGAKGRAE